MAVPMIYHDSGFARNFSLPQSPVAQSDAYTTCSALASSSLHNFGSSLPYSPKNTSILPKKIGGFSLNNSPHVNPERELYADTTFRSSWKSPASSPTSATSSKLTLPATDAGWKNEAVNPDTIVGLNQQRPFYPDTTYHNTYPAHQARRPFTAPDVLPSRLSGFSRSIVTLDRQLDWSNSQPYDTANKTCFRPLTQSLTPTRAATGPKNNRSGFVRNFRARFSDEEQDLPTLGKSGVQLRGAFEGSISFPKTLPRKPISIVNHPLSLQPLSASS